MDLIFCSNGIWCDKKESCLRFDGPFITNDKIYNSFYDSNRVQNCEFYIKKGTLKSKLIEKNNWKWI